MKTATLEAEGWRVAVVWSCETKNVETLAGTLSTFLGPAKIRTV
jgi:G:T-mismatch repair DNA endonuclease (very short patch repair protein)